MNGWVIKQEAAVKAAGIDGLATAHEVETVLAKFPNWRENPDEKRMLRRSLYKPLLSLAAEERAQVIERIMQVLELTA